MNGQRVQGRHILLATGSVPKSLPGLNIDGDRIISSDHALKLDRVPKSAIVLGGGVIGVEFASAWKSFGTDVTIVEGLKHLVPVEDENSSKLLERAFRKRGIKFNLGTFFDKAEYTQDGVKVTLADGKTFEAEVLLVAIGRGPVSQGLGYEEAGVAMDRGYVLVDEYMQTNVPTSRPSRPRPDSPARARRLRRGHPGGGAAGRSQDRADRLRRRAARHVLPPGGRFGGHHRAKAKELYGADKVVALKYNLAGNGKSKILKTAGEIKLVQVKDGAVVGVHMVGDRMGEQVGEAQLVYNWEALPAEVAQLIHAHPTQNEALGEAHLALAGKPLHSHD